MGRKGNSGMSANSAGGFKPLPQEIEPQFMKKFQQFTKKEQNEIARIDYFGGYWTIVLRNHDRVISEDTWGDVKWELKQMVKSNDFTLEW